MFIYPDEHNNMYGNPLYETIKEFYDNISIFPRCLIGAEIIVNKQIQKLAHYRFQNIETLETYY